MKKYLLLVLFLFSSLVVFAQAEIEIVQIKTALPSAADSSKATLLNRLSWAYIIAMQYDSAFACASRALQLARTRNQPLQQAGALRMLAYACLRKRQLTQAADYAQQSIAISNTIGDEKGKAEACYIQGTACLWANPGEFDKALGHLAAAVQSAKAAKDTTALLKALERHYQVMSATAGVAQTEPYWQELTKMASSTFYQLPDVQERVLLWCAEFAQVLEDTSRSYRIEQVASAEFADKFTPNIYGPFKQVNPRAVYWLKVRLRGNRLADKEYLLASSNFWAKQTLYLPTGSEGGKLHFEEKHAGIYVPLSQADYIYRYPNFKLMIPKQTVVEFYLRFEAMTWGGPRIDFYVDKPELLMLRDTKGRFLHGLFSGILLIIAVYSLIFFLWMKENLYMYYLVMILSLLLCFLFQYQFVFFYVFPESPVLSRYLMIVCIIVALSSILKFSNQFLNSRVFMPRWRLYTHIIIGLLFPPLLFDLYLYFFTQGHYPGNELFMPYRILGSIIFVSILVQGVLTVRKGYKPAYYFIIANVFLVAGGIVYSLSTQGLITLGEYDRVFIQFGLLLQILMFLLGIGYRVRTMGRERQRAVEENLRLQQEMTRDLEEKVLIRTAEISQQKEEIEAQHEELQAKNQLIQDINTNMMASIHYAKRIQEALLPARSRFRSLFPQSFIFYKPKGIVCGDFYWFAEVDHQGVRKKILIAADCTGHGVPGAFMTVLGNAIFNSLILEKNTLDAVTILAETDRQVCALLRQRDADIQSNDGMDAALLIIDEAKKEITYAGAKNPLYYVRASNPAEIMEIKASKYPIGGSSEYEGRKVFESHVLSYEPGDIFYLSSDGFQDQFGGDMERKKKFMTRRFREFLLRISQLPMEQQQQRLAREFEEWKGNEHQTDDVLVVGVRV